MQVAQAQTMKLLVSVCERVCCRLSTYSFASFCITILVLVRKRNWAPKLLKWMATPAAFLLARAFTRRSNNECYVNNCDPCFVAICVDFVKL